MPISLFALILEDNVDDFDIVARELRRAGFTARCLRVETEEEFRIQLEANPDIILADYMLPKFSALGALKALQESSLDIPFIVLTGAVNEETVVDCMKRGAADYLLKDRLTRLGPAVKRALEESELRRQKRVSETAFRKSNERFQQLVETTNVIPWEFDLETWRFIYVGPQAVTILGHAVEEWYKEGFWGAHVYTEDRDALYRLRGSRDASPKDYDFTCRMLTSNGSTLWLHCVVKVATCDKCTRILRGFMVNITELKATQESLARHAADLAASNAELQQFANVASHDLQEPLRMVSFYTQVLAKRYKGKLDADADEFIGYALEGATRMADLIKHLLKYSRVSARRPDFTPTCCEAAFEESMANLQLAVENSGAVVTHDPLPVVPADSSQVGQLLQNLIANAIKFHSGAAPHVHVSACENRAEWVFSVKDDGIGIEPQYFDTIFGIFQRLHAREEYPGSGVGLAICRKIIERHRGRIWVESEPGAGSTFCFTIPKEQEAKL
jgi:PAS domain S-box-containing protein